MEKLYMEAKDEVIRAQEDQLRIANEFEVKQNSYLKQELGWCQTRGP